MKKIQEAVLAMGGHQGKECYSLMCMAIEEALRQQPLMPKMKELTEAVRKKAHKKMATAVSKALERAVADLWQYGDLEVLGRYQHSWKYERPYPKEFIYVVAQHLWDGNREKECLAATSGFGR